jgi:hypothetical protein
MQKVQIPLNYSEFLSGKEFQLFHMFFKFENDKDDRALSAHIGYITSSLFVTRNKEHHATVRADKGRVIAYTAFCGTLVEVELEFLKENDEKQSSINL